MYFVGIGEYILDNSPLSLLSAWRIQLVGWLRIGPSRCGWWKNRQLRTISLQVLTDSLKLTLNIICIAPTVVLHLKHFWDLFSRQWPMFALEAVSLTELGNSELQCYSFFVPLWGKGSSLHWSDRPIFVLSAMLSIFIFCKRMLFWNSLQYSACFPFLSIAFMLHSIQIGTSQGFREGVQGAWLIANGLLFYYLIFHQ